MNVSFKPQYSNLESSAFKKKNNASLNQTKPAVSFEGRNNENKPRLAAAKRFVAALALATAIGGSASAVGSSNSDAAKSTVIGNSKINDFVANNAIDTKNVLNETKYVDNRDNDFSTSAGIAKEMGDNLAETDYTLEAAIGSDNKDVNAFKENSGADVVYSDDEAIDEQVFVARSDKSNVDKNSETLDGVSSVSDLTPVQNIRKPILPDVEFPDLTPTLPDKPEPVEPGPDEITPPPPVVEEEVVPDGPCYACMLHFAELDLENINNEIGLTKTYIEELYGKLGDKTLEVGEIRYEQEVAVRSLEDEKSQKQAELDELNENNADLDEINAKEAEISALQERIDAINLEYDKKVAEVGLEDTLSEITSQEAHLSELDQRKAETEEKIKHIREEMNSNSKYQGHNEDDK